MRILVSGMLGHMGRIVAALAGEHYRGSELAGGIDANADGNSERLCVKCFADVSAEADCIVDFSHHAVTGELLSFAVNRSLPVVLATTGHTAEEKELIARAAEKIPVFYAANMSLGIALLIELAQKTAQAMPDAEIEIIEKHHDRKLDAPSGTALAIAEALREARPDAEIHSGRSGQGKRSKTEIGIHAIRMGNIVGEHEVIIGTGTQTITLKHEAHDRALFAEGAIAAAEFLCGKPAGLYGMKDMVRI